MKTDQRVKTANWLIVIVGIWLILSPFFLGFSGTSLSRNDVIFGILFIVASLIRIGVPENSDWLNWLSALMAVWLFISPFMMASVGVAGLWNNLIFGVIAAGLSLWGTLSSSTTQLPKAV